MKIQVTAKKYLKTTYDFASRSLKYIHEFASKSLKNIRGFASRLLKYIREFANKLLRNIRDFASRSLKYIRDRAKASLKYVRNLADRSLKYILALAAEGTQSRRILKIVFFPVILLLLLIIALFLPDWGNPSTDQSVLYLLSAISQSLAAAFALTFTVTIFCMQMSAKYGQKAMSKFFRPDVIAYMVFFVFCIIFPLFLINSPISYLVNLTLLLSIVALFSLIPYFYSIKKQLTIQEILNELFKNKLEEVKRRFRIADYDAGITELDSFYEITMNTYSNRDFEGYKYGIHKLIEIGMETERLHDTYWESVRQSEDSSKKGAFIYFSVNCIVESFNTINNIINEVFGNYRSILIIVERLRENGKLSAERGIVICTKHILNCLSYSFGRIITNRIDLIYSERVARESISAMRSISEICVRDGLDEPANFAANEFMENTIDIVGIDIDEYQKLLPVILLESIAGLSWFALAKYKIEQTESMLMKLWILGALFKKRTMTKRLQKVVTEIKYYQQFYRDIFIINKQRSDFSRTSAGSHLEPTDDFSYYRSRVCDLFDFSGIDLQNVDRTRYSDRHLRETLDESYVKAERQYDQVSKHFRNVDEYLAYLRSLRGLAY